MRLELLRSFVAVVDCGSYARGAELLNMSQPTIYQHVRQLEREFSVRLVEQHGKRVSLTSLGRTFYDYARQVSGLSEDVRKSMSLEAERVSGNLVLVAGTTLGDFVLPAMCVRFQRSYPDVNITLRVQTPLAEVERVVRDHEADLGFSGQQTSVPGIVSLPFLADELAVIVPRHHPLAGARVVTPRDLAQHPTVLPAAATFQSLRSLINTWFEEAHERPFCSLETNSVEGIKNAVRAGGGAGLVSRLVMRDDDTSLRVVAVASPPSRPFYMLARSGRRTEGPSRLFREFVTSGEWKGE